jgi:hypothetical protein
MIKGQRNVWFKPAQQREQERALKLEPDRILRDADRRRRTKGNGVKKPAPPPLATKNGWVSGLANLRRAMRVKAQS